MHQYVRLMIIFAVVAALSALMDYRLLHAGDWLPPIPETVGVWTSTRRQLGESELAILGNPRYVARDYVSPAGELVGISVLAASSMNTYHDPRSCSLGAGFTLTGEQLMPVEGVGSNSPRVRAMVLRKDKLRSILFYWLQNSDGSLDTEGAIRHDIVSRLASAKTIFSTVATGRRTCVIRVYTFVSPDDENGIRARRNVAYISRMVYRALKGDQPAKG